MTKIAHGLISTHVIKRKATNAFTSQLDYFMAGKSLLIDSTDCSVIGWVSDKEMATAIVDAYNEKALRENKMLSLDVDSLRSVLGLEKE